MVSIFKFLRRRPGEEKLQEKLRNDIPRDASQIIIVTTPIEYIRAGEKLMQEQARKQKGESLCK